VRLGLRFVFVTEQLNNHSALIWFHWIFRCGWTMNPSKSPSARLSQDSCGLVGGDLGIARNGTARLFMVRVSSSKRWILSAFQEEYSKCHVGFFLKYSPFLWGSEADYWRNIAISLTGIVSVIDIE
jgi:hypothetical protein